MTPEEAREHWIALVELQPTTREARGLVPVGAYAYVVAKADSAPEFEAAVKRAASAQGFEAAEFDEVEVVNDRWLEGRLGRELYNVALEAVNEQRPAFGTFYRFTAEDEDSSPSGA